MTIRSLQHVALAVPDPAKGRKFYTDFGLDAREDGKSIAMRCFGRDQDQVVLVEGPKKRLHHVCFGATPAGLAAAKARLRTRRGRMADSVNAALGDDQPLLVAEGLVATLNYLDGMRAPA